MATTKTALFTCMMLLCAMMLPFILPGKSGFTATPVAAQTISQLPLFMVTSSGDSRDDLWGQDVILAATLGFGLESLLAGPAAEYEGVMFPFYLGALSFQDENNEKMLIFTPAPGYDAQRLIDFFENINRRRCVDDGYELHPLDDPDSQFCSALKGVLYRSCIFFVYSFPIGTAKDFDFNFIEQTEFVYKDVTSSSTIMLDQSRAFMSNNIRMTPKE